MLEFSIISVIISLLVGVFLSVRAKKKVKVDKGFKINYFGLSYRRKMIRTIINFPVVASLLFAMNYFRYWSLKTVLLWGLLFFLVNMVQLLYNYNKWKRHEA
ncbi:hypothetical protein BEP19_09160 [Ammoniphilus oxalaticus]|uniref:Uncharacterized protein n=1 Tax=Ammoniphilus oxalaticus TaxID=66863 RepID=A0A419SKK6_9BACL|nr:ATPase [Ammoniphilus oxalaticus]RKD24541.1 hypothetical protein BEP19_09160 [Ammoniphilus oxalaticus]